MKVKPLQTCRHQSTVRCSWLQSWISHLYQTFMRWWKEKKAHIIKCRMVSSPLHWGVCGPHDSVHCPTCSPSSAYNHCKQTNERHILNILHRLRSLNCVSNRYPEEALHKNFLLDKKKIKMFWMGIVSLLKKMCTIHISITWKTPLCFTENVDTDQKESSSVTCISLQSPQDWTGFHLRSGAAT